MNARVEKLVEKLEEPLIVTDEANVRYLTGFVSSNVALVVEPERVRLFTDFRYATAARAVEDVEFVETRRLAIQHMAELLEGTFGFESAHLTYAAYELLRDGGLELVPRGGLVERLRAVKDEDELERIRRAAEITNRAYEQFAEEKFVGRSEKELAWRMTSLLHELGAEAVSFETIVAGSANGAQPHADPTDRPIEPNTTVVVDAGGVLDGYCSDCTRTFATGELPDELARAYEICLDAQLKGLEAARAGVEAKDTDAAARSVIAEAGLGEKFGHGLGHGVGIDVHEAPHVAATSEDMLVANNVCTIEPGIYLEDVGGIRIEDLVVVTDGEPEVLTSFPKELVTVS
ncbi:MAG: M24 family metallopeptidase [Gaiellaceae bacterium]